MLRRFSFALLAAAFTMTSLQADQPKSEGKPKIPDLSYVKFATNFGDIYLELNANKAPITVENFLKYVDDGFYNGTIFHRVIPNFVIQGGGFDKELKQRPTNPPIKNESMNGLKNERGTISMARTQDPDSATSQFFLNVQTNTNLDPRAGVGYAVFGRVVSGMDIVDKIRYIPTENKGGAFTDIPSQTAVIEKATRLSEGEVKDILAKEEKKKGESKGKQMDEGKNLVKTKGGDIGKGKSSPSGLWWTDTAEGSGETPKPTSNVTVHYTGWLTNGTKFDSSRDRGQPTSFPLNGVIKGWTEGVGSMKKGGKRYLVIPPEMAYGPRDMGTIPPNSTLVFEVELIDYK